MFFLNENIWKNIYRIIPTDLPKKMAYFSEFFHLMFFQLSLGNSNLQGTGENSSIYRKFEFKESLIFKFHFVKKETFARVKVISSSAYKYT